MVYSYNLYEIPMSQNDIANAAHGQNYLPSVPWKGDINDKSVSGATVCWPVAEKLVVHVVAECQVYVQSMRSGPMKPGLAGCKLVARGS